MPTVRPPIINSLTVSFLVEILKALWPEKACEKVVIAVEIYSSDAYVAVTATKSNFSKLLGC